MSGRELALRIRRAGKHALAAQAYGWAHFPTLADEPKRTALAKQLEQYQLAAPQFSANFRAPSADAALRRYDTRFPSTSSATQPPREAPVMLFSGGVDSWKMDLHGMIMAFVRDLPVRALAFDIPGTGESQLHLGRPGTQIIDGLVRDRDAR